MNRKVVVEEELKKGWEATSQLRSLLSKIEGDNKSVMNETNELDKEKLLSFTENYCATIINSFDTCMSILKDTQTSSRYVPNHTPKSHALGKVGQNLTVKSKHPRVKMIESPNLVPDCYLWRKYGQKQILHTKHPREYYRCAYRDDQNCRATKHVQKISDNPTKYKIIYYSNHTCQPNLLSNNVPQSKNLLDFRDNNNEPTNLISFESKITTFVPKQVVNNGGFNSSSPSHVGDMPLLAHSGASTSKITAAICPSASNFVDSTTIISREPLLAYESACHNGADVMYSPNNILMSPTYMGSSSVQVEDYTLTVASDETKYYELNGALQSLDLPLWEDNYTDQ